MIRKLSHRIAWLLVVVCLAASAAADSYHPDILKWEVVTLDAGTIERWANSGTPFELTLGEKMTMNVVLEPAPVFPEEGVTIVQVAKDGSKETVLHGNFTYAGEILGEDPATTEVRLTIAGGVLEGYVLSSTDWWFIEPLVRFDPKAASDQYLVYASRDTGVTGDFGQDDLNEEVADWTLKNDTIPLAMVVDREYLIQSDVSLPQVRQRHATLVNGVNGIYKMQFGREFRVPTIVIDLGEQLVATHALDLLNQLKGFVTLQKLAELRCHIAHLTTGKDLDFDALGISERRGFRSLSQQSKTLEFRNEILAAREIGGNFGSVPEEAEEHVLLGLIIMRTLDHRTFDSRTTIPRFSDGRQGPDRNNVERICIFLAERGWPCR